MELTEISKILGLRKSVHSLLDLIDLAQKGIKKSAIRHLANYFSISMLQMVSLLPISMRTIQRYPPDYLLNQEVSEQILSLAKIAAKGTDTFKDKEKFLLWIHQPSVALGNNIPFNLLRSRIGTEMVLEELGRIEYGVMA